MKDFACRRNSLKPVILELIPKEESFWRRFLISERRSSLVLWVSSKDFLIFLGLFLFPIIFKKEIFLNNFLPFILEDIGEEVNKF